MTTDPMPLEVVRARGRLSPRERVYAESVAAGQSPELAAKTAGYRSPRQIERLAADPSIAQYVAWLRNPTPRPGAARRRRFWCNVAARSRSRPGG